MAYIKISLDHTILDGETVTFKAPCDCTAVDGIKVYYPTVSGSSIVTASKEFTFKDAHGNALTGLGNLFAEGAYIQAILNVTDGAAHILNADTNKYIEDLVTNSKVTLSSSVSSTSTITAASSYAVKETYDKANSAYTLASEKPSVTSGTVLLDKYASYPSPLSWSSAWVRIGDIVHVNIHINPSTYEGLGFTNIMFGISGLPSPKIGNVVNFLVIIGVSICAGQVDFSSNIMNVKHIEDAEISGSFDVGFSYIAD